MSVSVCLSIYPSVCLSLCPSVCLSDPPTYLSVCVCHLSVCLLVRSLASYIIWFCSGDRSVHFGWNQEITLKALRKHRIGVYG
ncbi:hypothetical protein Y032_0368g48 [Ancylostoma ceylanicum]|uniref:Uncharacterized protein n=1 Tax=Ancylostoma ceylanicum TaxID=53326 RepID=A0A016RUH2_9BILA|nr:hypothetical protein Y032_0368g48 [Ancylostoma ceylanicum]